MLWAYEVSKLRENAMWWLVRKLPRSVRYFTTMSVLGAATTDPALADREVPSITIEELLPVLDGRRQHRLTVR